MTASVLMTSSGLYNCYPKHVKVSKVTITTVVTWNGGEGDTKTADISDVHRGLEQRLDGVERRHVLREVCRGSGVGRLLLARAQLVEVAVGRHVGAGGGDHHHDQEHQGRHHGGHGHLHVVCVSEYCYQVFMMVTHYSSLNNGLCNLQRLHD